MMSATMRRTRGRVRFASCTVKYFVTKRQSTVWQTDRQALRGSGAKQQSWVTQDCAETMAGALRWSVYHYPLYLFRVRNEPQHLPVLVHHHNRRPDIVSRRIHLLLHPVPLELRVRHHDRRLGPHMVFRGTLLRIVSHGHTADHDVAVRNDALEAAVLGIVDHRYEGNVAGAHEGRHFGGGRARVGDERIGNHYGRRSHRTTPFPSCSRVRPDIAHTSVSAPHRPSRRAP